MRRGAGFGIIILGIGIVYLLDQAGVISLTPVWWSGRVLWPLVLVLIGGSGLHEFRRGRIPWGSLFFVVLGLSLSARATGFFPWLNPFTGGGLFWSLLLIFVGLYFLFPKRWRGHFVPVIVVRGKRRDKKGWKHGAASKSKWDFSELDDLTMNLPPHGKDRHREHRGTDRHRDRGNWRLIGDLSIGGHPWVLRDMELWNGIGDIRVNLATAHVEDGDYHLDIGGWIGDVRVLVPDTLDVAVDGDVGVGDLEVFGERHAGTGRAMHIEDENYAQSTRRCKIVVRLKIGDVQIVRV